MELIRKAMRKDLENDKTLMSKWATVAGLKNPNPLYDFLNHDGKTFNEFSSLVNIVKSQYSDREYELMKDYCLHLDVKTKAARSALEYADANKFDEITDTLLERMVNCTNSKSKEYGQVYEIHRSLTNGEIEFFDASNNLGRLKLKTEEMNIFSKILTLYHYLNTSNFAPMQSLIDQIDLSGLKENQFIKNSFQTRIYVLRANVYLNENDLEKCREYSMMAIESTDVLRFKVFSYLTLGNSFVFSDYSESRSSYIKGLNASENNKLFAEYFKRNLSFLSNVWNKENEWLNINSDDITDIQEVAHFLINKKEDTKARQLLQLLESKDQNYNELGFHYYLKGLFEQNIDYFYDSIEFYKKSQDKFLIKLPLIALENSGVNKRLLKLISM
ncbi:AimR family lysis-lysogeny pheromone receptor [Bacillus atrophaeus]|uniref:AimR family lysis-lysogeny pheromone receptor n=1 Tax=Bacillus atrophaeus TaxID=1452 RepID=UPI00228015B1|nr:AimR family lysis-lysogeny pheromone receptor [Bacillus atrophaeus]MCY8934385.1 AimR family lysis-lysogeny pheromone receptor [Bacillus atrophaeus]